MEKHKKTHWCCAGTYIKRKDNLGFALEPIENARKAYVLHRGNENVKKTHVLRGTYGKQKENNCVA